MLEVTEISVERTYDLRRRVLRDGDATAAPLPQDDQPGAFHLGALTDLGAAVGVASLAPEPCPVRPGARAVRLRGMAVEPARQGEGIGRRVLDAAVDRADRRGYAVLWANARDTALGFYERAGMTVVGDGFRDERGLPHHVVVLDLTR